MKRIHSILAIAALWAAPMAFAQTASIHGAVTDQSGGLVSQAAIRVTNLDTGVRLETASNDRGLYVVPFLPPGSYKIEATKTGFAPALVDHVKLDVQQTARVDIILSVGAATQAVEVSAAAAILESESTQMGQTIENKRIVEMPLNKRNYLELARLAPGVLPAQTMGVGAASGSDGGVVGMGQRAHQTNVLLDGVDNSARTAGGELGSLAQGATPSVDAVGEFRVITNNFSAEFGYRTGPKVLVSLKSGTNRLHGTLFEFLRNDKLDASNFFANRSGSPKPPYKQNQFGATAGGRIIKDKTFLFASYQGTRTRIGKSQLSTVPSALARIGNFSGEATNRNRIFDPATTTGTAAAARRLPFPNNTIPKSLLDPVVQNIMPLYPLSNVSGRDFAANNYFQSPSDTADGEQFDAKFDHNFSQRDRMFVRYSGRKQDQLKNSPLPVEAGGNGGYGVEIRGDNYAGNWVHTLSPSAFNELRFGYTHLIANRADLLLEPLNAKYGIKNAPGEIEGLKTGFSLFSPTGYATLGNSNTPLINSLDNIHMLDSVAIQKGAHSLKMGAEYRRSDQLKNASRVRRGNFTFSGVYTSEMPNVAASRSSTGNGLADMLLGLSATTRAGTTSGENPIVPYWGTYFQDDWKVSSKLTVNIGLRWELYQSAMYIGGTLKTYPGVSNFLTQYSGVFPGDPLFETFVKPKSDTDCGCQQDWNNFSPRLGIAYRLSPKTVVRASGGIFFGEGDGAYISQTSFSANTPEFTETTTNGTNTEAAALVVNGFPKFELPATKPVEGSSITTTPRKRVNFYSGEWFFDIQRELPGGMVWEIGYQGAKSTKLAVSRDVNNGGPNPTIPAAQRRLRPMWTAVALNGDPTGSSNYEALVTRLEKRYSKGLSLLAAYTWSHNIDNSTEYNDANSQAVIADMFNLRREHGNSNLDNRHNFTSSVVYELPFGRGRALGGSWSGAADAVLGGWQVGGLVTLRSGFPIDMNYPGDPQNTGTTNRGDRISSGVVSNPTIDRWFDQLAFVQSAPGVFGNTARNVLFGPGTSNFDLMAGKSFRMPWEGHSLQFRFESFNFTNTPKFGQPSATLRGPGTATITSADEPRRIQFGLKYRF